MKRIICSVIAMVTSVAFSDVPTVKVEDDASFDTAVTYCITGAHFTVRSVYYCLTNGATRVSPAARKAGVARLLDAKVFPKPVSFANIDMSEHRAYVEAWAESMRESHPRMHAFIRAALAGEHGAITRGAYAMYYRTGDRIALIGSAYGEVFAGRNGDTWMMRFYTHPVKVAAARQVKIHLRKQGKSFVTKDGVNPLDAYANRLEAILNAPRMAGLRDFCREIGLPETYAIPEESFLTDTEIKDICDKVLVDDLKLGSVISGMLRYSMGTEAYNKFVKLYNDGETK